MPENTAFYAYYCTNVRRVSIRVSPRVSNGCSIRVSLHKHTLQPTTIPHNHNTTNNQSTRPPTRLGHGARFRFPNLRRWHPY